MASTTTGGRYGDAAVSTQVNQDTVALIPGNAVVNVIGGVRRASGELATGIVQIGSPPGQTCQVWETVASLTTAEWDAVTGQSGGLTPNTDYFLSATAGNLSLAGQILVGRSLSSTRLVLKAALAQVPFPTQIEIDFGTIPLISKSFTVVDANVVETSIVTSQQSGTEATGKSADENEMDLIVFSSSPFNGGFLLNAKTQDGPVVGAFKVNYYTVRGV